MTFEPRTQYHRHHPQLLRLLLGRNFLVLEIVFSTTQRPTLH